MVRKYTSLVLIGFLLNHILCSTAPAQTEKEIKFAEKVKTKIAKLGSESDTNVHLKLKDDTKFEGYVREIKPNSFRVKDKKTGLTIEVGYSQVKQVKRNLSMGATIAITIGAIVLISLPAMFSKDGI